MVATAAPDGQVALSLLHSGLVPCLILVDLVLPGMSGLDFKAEIARDPVLGRTPVILMSASQSTVKTLGESITALPKPLPLDLLMKAVEQHCRPAN